MDEMKRDSISTEEVGNIFGPIAAGRIYEMDAHEGYVKDWKTVRFLNDLANLAFLQASLYADFSQRKEYSRLRIQSTNPIRIGQDYERRHINGVNLASFEEKKVVIGDTRIKLDDFEKDVCEEMAILFYTTRDGDLCALGQGGFEQSIIPINGKLYGSGSNVELKNRVILGATFNISSPEYAQLDLIPFIDRLDPEMVVDTVDKNGVQQLATYLGRGGNFREV